MLFHGKFMFIKILFSSIKHLLDDLSNNAKGFK